MFKALFIVFCVLAAAMLIGSVAHISYTHHSKQSMTQLDKSKQIDNSIFLMSVSSWILIFFGICALNPSEHVLLNTFAMIGFLWPVLLLLSRMVHIRFDEKETGSESHVQHNDTRGSAGLLFTAAFGIGVILESQKRCEPARFKIGAVVAPILCGVPHPHQRVSRGITHLPRHTNLSELHDPDRHRFVYCGNIDVLFWRVKTRNIPKQKSKTKKKTKTQTQTKTNKRTNIDSQCLKKNC